MTTLPIFRYFKTSPEVIRLAVMMYVRYPISLRNVEDALCTIIRPQPLLDKTRHQNRRLTKVFDHPVFNSHD